VASADALKFAVSVAKLPLRAFIAALS